MCTNPLLSGIRVIDLSRRLPGALCALYLAQLGAEVIMIEPPGGDPLRSACPELFAQLNRGKKSATLNLTDGADAEALRQLAASADVLLESFPPGVMDGWGCGYPALRAHNPRLVYATLSGHGQSGSPWHQPGDDLDNPRAGALQQTGPAAGMPMQGRLPAADLAGALTCAVGVLAALHGVRVSAEGSFVDATDGGALVEDLAALLRAHSRGEWAQLLAQDPTCASPEQAQDDAQVRARGTAVDDRGEPAFNLPLQFSNAWAREGRAAAPGEHNADVLAAAQRVAGLHRAVGGG